MLRVVLLGVFLLLMGWEPHAAMPPAGPRGALAVLTLFAIGGSDLLDGFLARRYGLSTRLGVILDAVADKIAQVGTAAYLVFFTTLIPLWFLLLLLARDVVMGIGTWRVMRLAPGTPLRHRAHGKAASFVMFVLFVWTLSGAWEAGRWVLLLGVAALVVISTAAYVAEGRAAVRARRRMA